MNNTPTPEQVKNIFKDTYLFYLKYINLNSDSECQAMMKESNEIYKKYPFDMCKNILLDICEVINQYAIKK